MFKKLFQCFKKKDSPLTKNDLKTLSEGTGLSEQKLSELIKKRKNGNMFKAKK